MNHKPMLACDAGDISALVYPLGASPKLDGVRAITTAEGVTLSRSLKPIPNRHVQAFLSGLPGGLDGELIVGDETAADSYRKTVSVVMSDDKPIDGLVFHVFDVQNTKPYWQRREYLVELFRRMQNVGGARLVVQYVVRSSEHLAELESAFVEMGYEGAILRRFDSPYKHGRSTLSEGYLLKLKRFEDAEAEVIGVEEMMHNANEATVNELGRTARSSKKEGLRPTGVMGKLVVRDVQTGVVFKIGSGFTARDRCDIWATYQADTVNGRSFADWALVKYKHQPCGAKDKPRIPIFVGWRDKRDL